MTVETSAPRRIGWAGPLAALSFTVSVVVFAAMRTDGYSHATKAVSELGAVGAEGAAAFNILGFIIPGLLIAVLANGFGRRIGAVLLAVSGLGMVLAGAFPVNLEQPRSATSVLHAAGALSSGLFWALSLFWLGPLLKRRGLEGWGRLTPWFSLFAMANVGWQIAFAAGLHAAPGYGQRLAFAGYFLWAAITGVLLATRTHPRPR